MTRKNADGPSKKGKGGVTELNPDHDIEVPPMPDAEDWLGIPGIQTNTKGYNDQAVIDQSGFDPSELKPEWKQPVKDWWVSIWQSPMASEFVDSDIHGLYMACYYLQESLNPFYKSTDRASWSKQWENAIKNYGLTPSARESLRWNISQGTAAQRRTDQIRQSMSAGTTREEKNAQVHDIYDRYA